MINPATIQVRFSDLDVLGHVNNNVYLSYFEMTRVHYFRHLLGQDYNWQKDGVVLVKNSVEYLKPVYLHDEVQIKMFVNEIGNKSFSLGYELRVGNEIRSKGASTLVSYDSLQQVTTKINPEMMKALKVLTSEQ